MEIDFYFIRERVTNKQLIVSFTIKDQLVDILTKPLSNLRFNHLTFKLNVVQSQVKLKGECKRNNRPADEIT